MVLEAKCYLESQYDIEDTLYHIAKRYASLMKAKKNFAFYFISLFLGCAVVSCTSSTKKDEPVTAENKRDTIVFIFDGFHPLERKKVFDDGTSFINDVPDFVFKDDVRQININTNATGSDTMVVATSSSFIVAFHRINLIESFEYLLRKGDSVVFTYGDAYPHVKLLNRECKAYDLNWEAQFRKDHLKTNSFSAMVKYAIPELASNSINNVNYKDLKVKYYPLYKDDLNKEEIFLDSLYLNELLSDEVYTHFKDRVKYRLLTLEVENNQLDSAAMTEIIKKEASAKPESHYSYFDDFQKAVLNKLFIEKVKLISTGNGFTRDHRVAYDNIRASSLLPKKLKDKILFQQLIQISRYFSLKDFNNYYKKFKADNVDTALIEKVEHAYLMDLNEIRNSSGDLFLITTDKRKFTFDSLKRISEGQLLYVDFWASWCGPCREAMPFSKRLMDKYKGQVKFIYLSCDRDFEKWTNALKDEGLEFYEDSYLMINANTSAFLKRLKFNEIPRYMLFDENGTLIHGNAPGPGTVQLEKLFEQNLHD